CPLISFPPRRSSDLRGRGDVPRALRRLLATARLPLRGPRRGDRGHGPAARLPRHLQPPPLHLLLPRLEEVPPRRPRRPEPRRERSEEHTSELQSREN